MTGAPLTKSLRNTIRTLHNQTTEIVTEMEANDPDIGLEALMPHISGTIGRKAYETGDVSRGLLSAGQALGMTDKIAPFADIVAQLEQEAEVALSRLGCT